jgi:glucan 1,3-beta-glucosidase
MRLFASRVGTTTAACLVLAALATAQNLRSEAVVPSAAGYADKAPAAAAAANASSTLPQYRGVNLGGWLVLESWMYPEWWKTTGVEPWRGEMQFVGSLGNEKAKELLEKHWDTWVTKADLQTLKRSGIEHLRVPVGYWIMGDEYLKDGETYLPGGYPYLLRLLGWCKELGLKAIIDLHGAPGSQNGHDNSGFQGGNYAIQWDKPENLQRTTDVLVAMAKNFTEVNKQAAYKDTVLGLCLLNEPWTERVMGTVKMDTLKEWVQEATDAVVDAGWTGQWVGGLGGCSGWMDAGVDGCRDRHHSWVA